MNYLTSREKTLYHKEHQQALHFVSVSSLSCCFSLFFLSLIFSCNTTEHYFASVFLCLHESLHPSFSLSLSILGFIVFIPEGQSIDCNSLSMKSPLRYRRKETVFNRTDNSLLLFLLITPSLPFYKYNLPSSLFCALV